MSSVMPLCCPLGPRGPCPPSTFGAIEIVEVLLVGLLGEAAGGPRLVRCPGPTCRADKEGPSPQEGVAGCSRGPGPLNGGLSGRTPCPQHCLSLTACQAQNLPQGSSFGSRIKQSLNFLSKSWHF